MIDRTNKEQLAAYTQVTILALAASVIYSAPYLRQLFKTSLLDAFNLTEIQLGNLSSTYAIFSIICYLPGGWLADRVAPRTLVIVALFASAATYAWYATIPGYASLLIIYALWGVIGVGILWAAMFKQVRLLAGADELGPVFWHTRGRKRAVRGDSSDGGDICVHFVRHSQTRHGQCHHYLYRILEGARRLDVVHKGSDRQL